MSTHAPTTPPGTPFIIDGTRRVLDIDAFDDVAGYAKIGDRTVVVHHLDGAAYRVIAELRATGAGDTQALYDAVARCCPELSRDDVDRLSGPKIGAILAVAEAGINEVEALIPNGSGPTAATSPQSSPPASSPEI